MSKKEKSVLQAVVFTDTFNDEFYPITKNIPSTLIPLFDRPILSHTLDALLKSGIEEVFLFCKSGFDAIQKFLREAEEEQLLFTILKINLVKAEGCRTLGDCFRELDGRGLIRGDFVLVEPGAITNIDLVPIFNKHKELLKKDKGLCLTMICRKTHIEQVVKCEADDCLYVYTPDGKLVFYKTFFNANDDNRTNMPMELLFKYDQLRIRKDQRDMHISICSEKFLTLFSDNFDFETKEEFIKNLLMNEEIMDCSMYLHEVDELHNGGAISNWQNYQTIGFEIFDMGVKDPSEGYREINTDNYDHRSIIGPKTKIPEGAKVSRCILGENVSIGKDVCLEDSIIFSNSVIGDCSNVKLSVVGSNCVLKNNCNVLNNSVLGDDVEISENSTIDKKLVQSTRPDLCDEKDILGEKAYVVDLERIPLPEMRTLKQIREKFAKDSEYVETDSEDDDSSGQPPELEDTELFLNEVVESLTRGLEDDVNCENLIFEINGSRYAYHIPLEEVNFFVVKGILKIYSQKAELKYLATILSKFKSILKNYIRNEESMKDCLAAVEDQAVSNGEEEKDWVLYILKWFYQHDILSEEAILKWGKALHPEEKLYVKIKPFLKWLEEAEEESSSDEED